jgi:riboflavin kinase/FMN adenylyltransferase
MTRLRPESAPARLSTFEQREAWLRAAGADEVIRLTPDDDLLGKSAREFVDWLLATFKPGFVVEGDDFHFGKGRSGNNAVLRELGQSLGFKLDVVPPVEVALGDDLIVRASSSILRWLISHGRVDDATRILGRPYELAGTVTKGDQRGRTIGYPTANLATDCLLPADGVYAGYATLPDNRTLPAAINVGARPTFNGVTRRLEAYLLDATPTDHTLAVDHYNWSLKVQLIAWVRTDLKFDDIPTLVKQIDRDCGRVRDLLALHEGRVIHRPRPFLAHPAPSTTTQEATA